MQAKLAVKDEYTFDFAELSPEYAGKMQLYLTVLDEQVKLPDENPSIEVRSVIDWICVSEQIKENNNIIRNLTGEYKKTEPDCREGVRAQLERLKELCKERNNLQEKQNDLKGQNGILRSRRNDKKCGVWRLPCPYF